METIRFPTHDPNITEASPTLVDSPDKSLNVDLVASLPNGNLSSGEFSAEVSLAPHPSDSWGVQANSNLDKNL